MAEPWLKYAPWVKYAEAAGTIVSATASEAASGVAGLAAGTASKLSGGEFVGPAVQAIESVQEAGTYLPRSEGGQEVLQSIGEGVQNLMQYGGAIDAPSMQDITNYFNKDVVPFLQNKLGKEVGAGLGASIVSAMAGAIPGKAPKLKGFHSSPHDFDKFSDEFIGTGEGNQAFSRGLYFGQNPQTASSYREQFKNKGFRAAESTDAYKFLNRPSVKRVSNFDEFSSGIKNDIVQKEQAGFSTVHYQLKDGSYLSHNEDTGIVRAIEKKEPVTYEVDIDVSEDELLDWDALIDEQSDKVTKALESIPWEKNEFLEEESWLDWAYNTAEELSGGMNPTGESLIKALEYEDDPKAIVDMLRAAGIKGIKYKDGFSRKVDNDIITTSNYVIYDPSLITISKKYAVAIPVAAALLADQLGVEKESLYAEEKS